MIGRLRSAIAVAMATLEARRCPLCGMHGSIKHYALWHRGLSWPELRELILQSWDEAYDRVKAEKP